MSGEQDRTDGDRIDRYERLLAEQQAAIEELRATVETQQKRIDDLRNDNRGGLDRRQLLQVGGLLGVLGLGATTGTASPSGQIGTEGRPLERIYTEQIRAPAGGSIGTESQPVDIVHTGQVTAPNGGAVGTGSDPMDAVYTNRVNAPGGELAIDQSVSIDGDIETAGQVRPDTPVVFRAYDESAPTYSDGDRLQFDTVTIDPGNNFDTDNYQFVAPVDGYYRVFFGFQWDDLSSGYVDLYAGGTRRGRAIGDVGTTVGWNGINDTCLLELDAGDAVYLQAGSTFQSYDGRTEYQHNDFHGELIAKL